VILLDYYETVAEDRHFAFAVTEERAVPPIAAVAAEDCGKRFCAAAAVT
jgi:hypothetical protein